MKPPRVLRTADQTAFALFAVRPQNHWTPRTVSCTLSREPGSHVRCTSRSAALGSSRRVSTTTWAVPQGGSTKCWGFAGGTRATGAGRESWGSPRSSSWCGSGRGQITHGGRRRRRRRCRRWARGSSAASSSPPPAAPRSSRGVGTPARWQAGSWRRARSWQRRPCVVTLIALHSAPPRGATVQLLMLAVGMVGMLGVVVPLLAPERVRRVADETFVIGLGLGLVAAGHLLLQFPRVQPPSTADAAAHRRPALHPAAVRGPRAAAARGVATDERTAPRHGGRGRPRPAGAPVRARRRHRRRRPVARPHGGRCRMARDRLGHAAPDPRGRAAAHRLLRARARRHHPRAARAAARAAEHDRRARQRIGPARPRGPDQRDTRAAVGLAPPRARPDGADARRHRPADRRPATSTTR